MQIGVGLPNNFGVEDVQALLRLGPAAERLGYDSVWASEHLLHTSYVRRRLGTKPYYEPLTVLTAIAAMTRSVRLGTSVLVLPYHNPIRLAKTVATLDVVSGGRVTLGVGVGVIEEEFEALGSPYRERGAYTDECIDVMRSLWTEEVPRVAGRFYRFEGMPFAPKPEQRPHPPLWIGGSSPAAIRRAARIGDGWHPLRLSPDELGRRVAALRRSADELGRDASGLAVSVRGELRFSDATGSGAQGGSGEFRGTAEEITASLHAYAAAGATHAVLSLNTGDAGEALAAMERFAEEVMPALAP